MAEAYPPTIIIRDSHESPRKCSIWPLRDLPGLVFLRYPLTDRPPLTQYIRLAAEGPPLSADVSDRLRRLFEGVDSVSGN